MKKLLLYCCIMTTTAILSTQETETTNDLVFSDEKAQSEGTLKVLSQFFDFAMAKELSLSQELTDLCASIANNSEIDESTINNALEQALQALELLDSDESVVAIQQQLQQEKATLPATQHKAAFAGLQVFDKLTVHTELNTYGPVSINSIDQQPALSVSGQAMIDNLFVGTASIQNITIPGDLTVNSLTANTIIDAGAAGNVGQVFTVGAGGKLSPSGSASGLQTIIGDSGSATQVGGNITFTGLPAGKTVTFSGAAATISLNSTDANNNTTIGKSAGAALTSGTQNTALGAFALNSNTGGLLNTAIGYQAMLANSSGGQNVALGVQALKANTSGVDNIAIGFSALSANTTGLQNIAIGTGSLLHNV
ncbi:MAG: hypothetical protein M1114_01660, partial [Candidatus Dependentiae bacterium]|nr:hypothetical protein [Candidatus Dependentiae bacterium]